MIRADKVNLEFLKLLQRRFRNLYREEELDLDKIRSYAGIDVSYRKGLGLACSVCCKLLDDEEVDVSYASSKDLFPYIPGFLFMREAPLMLSSLKNLKVKPDLIMVDGHGSLHPRRAGLAVFVGILSDLPCIGVAKSLLLGEVKDKGKNISEVMVNGEILGYKISPKDGKTFYVSCGYKVKLSSLKILFEKRNFSYPEALRKAHLYSRGKIRDYEVKG
ncbi:MAG: endonuclease V [Nitrososphaerales archaeon]